MQVYVKVISCNTFGSIAGYKRLYKKLTNFIQWSVSSKPAFAAISERILSKACFNLAVVTLVFISTLLILFKVEPYSIHGSFLKLEYLKTEINEDKGTYAIVKITSHSCRIMVKLSIRDYFEVMQHP